MPGAARSDPAARPLDPGPEAPGRPEPEAPGSPGPEPPGNPGSPPGEGNAPADLRRARAAERAANRPGRPFNKGRGKGTASGTHGGGPEKGRPGQNAVERDVVQRTGRGGSIIEDILDPAGHPPGEEIDLERHLARDRVHHNIPCLPGAGQNRAGQHTGELRLSEERDLVIRRWVAGDKMGGFDDVGTRPPGTQRPVAGRGVCGEASGTSQLCHDRRVRARERWVAETGRNEAERCAEPIYRDFSP